MKIEIWSDLLCPFCYIGKRRLEAALEEFEEKDKVEIIYKSFELNPDSPKSYDYDITTLIASKYGISYEQAKVNNDNIIRQAAEEGLNYNFDKLIPTNSFDAHRMIHFAKENGKIKEMKEELFKAYFVDSKNISDKETLADIAYGLGLDKAEALKVLDGTKYTDEVRQDEAEGSEIGVTGVPFFVINDKYAISGAHPKEAFLKMLKKAQEEE